MALLSHIPYSVLPNDSRGKSAHARPSGENRSASRRVEGSCAVRSRIDTSVNQLSPSREPDPAIRSHQTVLDLSYAGDEGGIMCHLSRSDETGQALVVSLTHVRVSWTMPFAAAIAAYQKHRVKKLKKQGHR